MTFNIEEYNAKVYPEGTKILVSLSTGFCGSDGHEFYVLTQDYTQEELDNTIWDMAKNHAEGYGYYPASEYEDCEEDQDDPHNDNYTDNIEGSFEIYDPKEHDGYMVGCRGTPYFNKL